MLKSRQASHHRKRAAMRVSKGGRRSPARAKTDRAIAPGQDVLLRCWLCTWNASCGLGETGVVEVVVAGSSVRHANLRLPLAGWIRVSWRSRTNRSVSMIRMIRQRFAMRLAADRFERQQVPGSSALCSRRGLRKSRPCREISAERSGGRLRLLRADHRRWGSREMIGLNERPHRLAALVRLHRRH